MMIWYILNHPIVHKVYHVANVNTLKRATLHESFYLLFFCLPPLHTQKKINSCFTVKALQTMVIILLWEANISWVLQPEIS